MFEHVDATHEAGRAGEPTDMLTVAITALCIGLVIVIA